MDLKKVALPSEWIDNANALCVKIKELSAEERAKFIEANRDKTWGAKELHDAFRVESIVGNKCWYTEAPIVGADLNIDHFRPKGRVREVNIDKGFEIDKEIDGYWWLAFDWENYRLSSQHANQRRTNGGTIGGKSDFFPVDGIRAGFPPGNKFSTIVEDYLPLDPCSGSDVAILRFSTEGKAIPRPGASLIDTRRVKVSNWLYHLDKSETASARMEKIRDAQSAIKDLQRDKQLYDQGNNSSKFAMDSTIARLKSMLEPKSPFRLAVHCIVAAEIKGTDLGDLVFGP